MQTQFTMRQAADILQLTRERLYQLEQQGKLAVTRGRLNRAQTQKMISYDELSRYIEKQTEKVRRQRERLHAGARGDFNVL